MWWNPEAEMNHKIWQIYSLCINFKIKFWSRIITDVFKDYNMENKKKSFLKNKNNHW